MNLLAKNVAALTGLLVGFGCLADSSSPPCWKLETEGAASGDVCWFSDDLASGTVYSLGEVLLRDGKIYCFYEGAREDRYLKQFGWLNGTWDSLRQSQFTSGQSVKALVKTYPWCSDNKETKARPLPKILEASEVSEETISLDTTSDNSAEYLSFGLLSSVNGQTKRLGKFYKGVSASDGSEEMLDVTIFAGCGWAMAAGQQNADHNGPKPKWNFLFNAKASSFDKDRNWWTGDYIDWNNCDNAKNFAFMKVKMNASLLPEKVRDFYRGQQKR